jgi:N-acetylmuramoyl-L-alanine amidase CwlD
LVLISKKWILVGGWVLLFLMLLLVTTRLSHADGPKFGNICLEGLELSQDFHFIEAKGIKYINLSFLRTHFHIATSWDQADTELYFKFGTYNFKMYARKTTYYVNGSRRTLSAAPFEKGGDFWLPLEFLLRLGLKVTDQTSRKHLYLEWKENYMLGIETISYQERPAFLIIGTKSLNLKHYTLQNPERVVCELAESKPHFTVNNVLTSSNPLVKKIRVKTDQANAISLLVFDMAQSASYRIINNPKEPNQAIVVFNYIINDIQLVEEETNTRLRIKSSFPADYKLKTIPESNQLLIKLSGATYPESSKILNGDNQKFGLIKINQDNPDTVSILLETTGKDDFFISRSRLNPNLLELKSPSIINEVNWSKTKNGSVLTISSNSELNENIHLLAMFKRLQIDLENARFDVSLPNILPVTEPLNSIRLLPTATNLARIEVNLSKLVAYDVKVSPDRHKITIIIKNSNLVGKTIVLDPGHGGIDTGACGKRNSLEKEINLEVALKLKTFLEMAGAQVLLTRNKDVFIGLYERCYFANYQKADLFISIHANSHPDPTIRGIEVFHYRGQKYSKKIAQKILNRLAKSTGLKPLRVKSARFVVIRETQMPSILIELGFLSNYQEESILKSSDFKEKAALGILQGLFDIY